MMQGALWFTDESWGSTDQPTILEESFFYKFEAVLLLQVLFQ